MRTEVDAAVRFRDRKVTNCCPPAMTGIESTFWLGMVLLAITALTSNRAMALENVPKELVCSRSQFDSWNSLSRERSH